MKTLGLAALITAGFTITAYLNHRAHQQVLEIQHLQLDIHGRKFAKWMQENGIERIDLGDHVYAIGDAAVGLQGQQAADEAEEWLKGQDG